MTSIAEDFAEALTTVRQPGTFYVAGTESTFAPGLAVQGVGPIALPLLPVQAEQLIAVAERAPYGRGSETLTDVGVRRTWQIAPQHVKITGRRWPSTLQSIVTRVAEGLGIAGPIDADLYKLLIYDKGSFFVPHRDTEKAPGMFATLILALPSVSQGGELIVRHKDHEARLPLHPDDPSDLAFAAFYADCVHEVRPVTAGHRLVLVYNLIRRGAGRLPAVPDHTTQEDEVAAILQQWVASPRAPEDPEKLIYLLEHAYTPAELGFDSLKGADSGIAQVVAAAAQRANCDVHLALIVIEENGIAEYNGDYRRGRYDDDDDDDEEFEVVEVNDQDAIATEWRRPDFRPSPLAELPIEEKEFSPPLSFEDLEPDEQHFHEATGNEGASFERTYRRTALILWPANRILAVINQGGPLVTLPFLTDLADRWSAGNDPTIDARARELADHMLADWPTYQWYPSSSTEPSDAGRFLDLLRRLNDTSRLQQLLTAIANRNGFDHADSASIAAALHALPPNQASTLAARLVEQAPEAALGSSANLLAHLSAINPALATAAARVLVAALPGEPKPASWHRSPVTPPLIVDLFTAFGRIDPTLAAISADHILDWPASYDFDTILIPAVHVLLDSPETATQPAVQRLPAACADHLDTRIALPLQPPADWRRDNKLGCTCKDCQALATYLDDPTQKTWVFAAAEPRRRHVEATIRTAKCDVDTTTEKRGSPHKLICTKNQASYQRRCEQRTNDLANRTRL